MKTKTFGFASLNTPGNETTLSGEVALKRAAPNATYEVRAGQEAPTFCTGIPVGTIVTNKEGNGNGLLPSHVDSSGREF